MMKNLLLVVVTMGILLLAGCPQPESNDRITLVIRPDFVEHAQGWFKFVSIIPGFQHKYDSMRLTATNKASGKILTWDDISTDTIHLTLPRGLYDLEITTPPLRVFSSYVNLQAEANSVDTEAGGLILMTTQVQQALLLIGRAGLDMAPLVSMDTLQRIPWIDEDYYYVYLKPDLDYYVNYLANGVRRIDTVYSALPGEIYTLYVGSLQLGVQDKFKHETKL